MRVSSAMAPSSSGTFRSARTRTRLPPTSAVRTDRGARITLGEPSARGDAPAPPANASKEPPNDVDQPAAVAPLVVVPTEHLDCAPVRHRQLAVIDARVRRAVDVGGDDRVLRVLQHPCERAGGCLAV